MVEHIDGPLYVERAGREGTPMILIHSLPNDHSVWLYQIAHLATWYRVVAVDLPGLGRSPRTRPGLSMADLSAACWDALDAVSREPAIIVGLSIGAGIAKYMAVSRPDRTRALVVTGAGYHQEGGALVAKRILRHEPGYLRDGIAYRRTQLEGNFSEAFRSSDLGRYFVDLFAERNATADVSSILALLRAHDPADPPDLHGAIAAPTLIVAGGADRSLERQRELQRRVAGAELVVLDGAGHCCNMEQPWAYDAAVLGFLARNGLGGPGTSGG
ncbi:MAG TPA: alpha/beta fold hydrolase [Gaiellaceae bacterium]|nr:alpha/beta fold hydrolase [Gaiellaceae bacterium]